MTEPSTSDEARPRGGCLGRLAVLVVFDALALAVLHFAFDFDGGYIGALALLTLLAFVVAETFRWARARA